MRAAFQLRKWYMDCIDDCERVFVGYSGYVKWGRLSTAYSASLVSEACGKEVEHRSFRNVARPKLTDQGVEWTCREIEVEKACWSASTAVLDRTLLEGDAGHLVWSVVHPRAEAVIHLTDSTMCGYGYVDYLDLTIRPWALPFDRLVWGRLHTSDHVVTWLRVDGRRPLTVVILDGVEKPDARVDDGRIKFEQRGTLDLELRRTVRSGTVAMAFPRLIRIALPAALKRMHEHKWLSLGTLRLADGSAQQGLAIHEVVTWN